MGKLSFSVVPFIYIWAIIDRCTPTVDPQILSMSTWPTAEHSSQTRVAYAPAALSCKVLSCSHALFWPCLIWIHLPIYLTIDRKLLAASLATPAPRCFHLHHLCGCCLGHFSVWFSTTTPVRWQTLARWKTGYFSIGKYEKQVQAVHEIPFIGLVSTKSSRLRGI